jgi:prevent-host-death family protein
MLKALSSDAGLRVDQFDQIGYDGFMGRVYSLYQAKAKLSEILRRVREGDTVTLSYRGEPVAEIRPIARDQSIEDRILDLEARGVVAGAELPATKPPLLARRPGALKRFLAERD